MLLHRLYTDPVTKASAWAYDFDRLTLDGHSAIFKHVYRDSRMKEARSDEHAASLYDRFSVVLDEAQCRALYDRFNGWSRPLVMFNFLVSRADMRVKARAVHRALYEIQEKKRADGIKLDAPAVSKPPEREGGPDNRGLPQLRDPSDRGGPQRRF